MQELRRRRGPARVVRVRFEPSRLAAACLADAYEQVVPLVPHRVARQGRRADPARSEVPWRKGGIAR